MIRITEDAEKHLANIYKSEGKYPKLAIDGGGCAGFQYKWEVVAEEEVSEDDEVVDLEGTKFVLDGMSLMYLYGSTIDFKSGISGSYLEVTSPAAASACGCGESVNFDMDMLQDPMDFGQDMFTEVGNDD